MKSGRLKKSLIAIAILLVAITLFWWVAVDRVVKMVIESEGSKAVGAKVDVSSADLSLWPAGLELSGIQVTDPASPMKNAMAIQRVFSDIELLPLIKRKVIINNLRMEGIRLNTPRAVSGALPQTGRLSTEKENPPPPWLAQLCEKDNGLQISMPSMEDILSNESLQSLQLAENLRSGISTFKSQWQQNLKELPSKEDFDALQSRLNHLKESNRGLAGLLGSAAELQKLHVDLDSKIGRIKSAQKKFSTGLDDLKQQSARLAKSPLEDVERLKSKYSLSPEGAANLSRMLFGPKVCDWWHAGYQWYAKLKPYLGDISGGSTSPAPDGGKKEAPFYLLIRQLHIDALLEAGQFTGKASDITTVPEILGKPMTFKLLGRQLEKIKHINMSGTIDLIEPTNPKHAVKLLVQQFALQNLNISDSKNLPLSIARAMADIDLDLNLTGPKLDALINAQLDSVQMAVAKSAGSELDRALAEAIAGVTRFGLTTLIQGSAPEYRTKIESDIDQVLQQAVSQIVRKTGKKFESQLKAAIIEKTQGPIDGAKLELKGANILGDQLTQRLNLGNELLKNTGLPFK